MHPPHRHAYRHDTAPLPDRVLLTRHPLPLLLFVVACAGEPDACEEMCTFATDLQEACLEEDGLSWSDLGYQDAEDHTAWCETWVWEQHMLDRDAGERGRVEAICAERAESFQDGTCDVYQEVQW